jgi:hypothetical protein
MMVMLWILAVRRDKKRSSINGRGQSPGAGSAGAPAHAVRIAVRKIRRPFWYQTVTWTKLDTGAMVRKNAQI